MYPLQTFMGRRKLYMDSIDSCYLKEFNARVTSVNENSVILDQTLFYPLGGGTEVFHLRAVTDTASQSGKVADEYFAGASYGKIWDSSFQYVDEIVSETVEECEIIYTKN